ncbi:FecR domain-containing protein, partial [Alistipes sp. OttesenSCG-928-B03]|nr:FecR domain-containing protein [Alistipes sp. OttesenSCG-928-B03]
ADEPSGEAVADVFRLRINVPRGGEFHLRLPDGSAVWLNSETILEYPEHFSDTQRDVYLSGEAFFDVTPDPAKPFRITTQDDLEVTVLGTKFNVQSYADADDACVTLLEGAVGVRHDADYIELVPDQQALFDRAGGELRRRRVADASIYAAWINGRFDFEAVTLGVIVGAMEKWYDMSIVCDESVMADGERYTIKLSRRSDITQTLDIMRDVAGFDYRIDGRTVYLFERR